MLDIPLCERPDPEAYRRSHKQIPMTCTQNNLLLEGKFDYEEESKNLLEKFEKVPSMSRNTLLGIKSEILK